MPWSYVIGPVLAALLLVVVYAMVRLAGPSMTRLRTAPRVVDASRRGQLGLGWVTERIAPPVLILVLGTLLVLGLAYLFVEILDGVVDKDDLTVIDRPVLDWLGGHRSATLTGVVTAVTNLGGAVFLTPAVAITAIVVARRLRSWRPIWISALTLGGVQLLVFSIKVFIARPRPDPTIPEVFARGFSFPSGHAASSLVGYVTIAWLICMVTPRGTLRATVWLTAALLTFAIGLSRVYLGVHYPTDVVAGWILGITWLTTVVVAVHAWPAHWRGSGDRP